MRIDYEPQASDILVFSGDDWASLGIKIGSRSKWNHIAPVAWVKQSDIARIRVRNPFHVHTSYFIPGGEWIDQFQVIESTSLATEECQIRGQKIKGVQAHNPITRIKHYRGKVSLLRLHPDYQGRFDRSGGSDLWTSSLLSKIGLNYDTFGAGLSGTHWLKWLMTMRAADCSMLFCSEQTRKALQLFDLVNSGNSGLATPGNLVRELLESGVYEISELKW